MNIYLDIDGVLLANENNPANFAKEFIAKCLDNHPTYWLTTHCRGDAAVPIQHIGHLFDDETVVLMEKILPTNWDLAKTEAIDFSQPFLWFDDDLYPEERAELLRRGLLENWIEVDLAKNENQLQNFLISFPLPKGS